MMNAAIPNSTETASAVQEQFHHRLQPDRGRFFRGWSSALGMFLVPIVPGFRRWLKPHQTPERHANGLTLILPGIDGESFLNHSVAWGLMDAGYPGAIDIEDWTTGNILRFLNHLRDRQRQGREAARIAERIVAYQREHPQGPVNLIGHSAGGAIALRILECLPAEVTVSAVVLLAPAVSPEFSLSPHLKKVDRGIWNFSSWNDWFFLRMGTRVAGTVDGRHTHSAGASGFMRPEGLSAHEAALYDARLREQPFSRQMVPSFNLGGHFGCTNRVFVSDWVAPLLETRDGLPREPVEPVAGSAEQHPCPKPAPA